MKKNDWEQLEEAFDLNGLRELSGPVGGVDPTTVRHYVQLRAAGLPVGAPGPSAEADRPVHAEDRRGR